MIPKQELHGSPLPAEEAVSFDKRMLYAGLSWKDAPTATLSLAISAYWYANTFNSAKMPEHFSTYALNRAITVKKESTVPEFSTNIEQVRLVAQHLINFADAKACGIQYPRQNPVKSSSETRAERDARKLFQQVDNTIRVSGNQTLISAITVGEQLMTDLVHVMMKEKSSENTDDISQ